MNVLLWASPGPQQTQGFAVWDLYRAEDADKVSLDFFSLPSEGDSVAYYCLCRFESSCMSLSLSKTTEETLQKLEWIKTSEPLSPLLSSSSQILELELMHSSIVQSILNDSSSIKS